MDYKIEYERCNRALEAIRKAAGSGTHFTNRLQYIYERAGVALSGEVWDDGWKAEYGFKIRNDTMLENVKLKKRIEELENELAIK